MTTTERKRDLYDYWIERLTKNPQGIDMAWEQRPPCRLFRFAAPTGQRKIWDDEPRTGDIVLVARGTDSLGRKMYAHTKSLMIDIQADKRIPRHVSSITPESLPVFAEWARRLDREFGEETPPHPEGAKKFGAAA